MTSFLSRLASAYLANERDKMIDYCFVFPNKRSGVFFKHFLEQQIDSGELLIEPFITTISDFIADFSDNVLADRYDLLFSLYNSYRRFSRETEEFDKFVFWGDMLLSDFNDVDMYMVDASELFHNLKNYREISSDYLTDEQKEVINKYWGQQIPLDNADRFWNHLTKEGVPRNNRDSFLQLWEILEPLYHEFRLRLTERGMAYSGMQYREVAQKLKFLTADDIPFNRVVFVGFNVLSISELKIFERFKDLGIADFYWDYSFPEFIDKNNPASHFIKRYVKIFPSLYDITEPRDAKDMPSINIVGIPSNIGQVKYAGTLLSKMVADGTIDDSDNAINTAIVLPSEELFIELIHSIPKEITSVNITMGYPLKLTAIASLFRNVMSMHLRAKKIHGKWCFFYEDVVDVLSNSLLEIFIPETCDSLRKQMQKGRMFNIQADYIAENYPDLKAVFFPIDDLHSSDEVFSYLRNLIDYISGELRKLSSDADNMIIETDFLTRYQQSIETLKQTADRYGIVMNDGTFFHLIDRTVSAESINFTGEPLKGLQIMGVLETRALDFDNIILLSMNERIFPRKHYTKTFIPNILRRSYGMATMEFQECIYAYYFYRMISGASNVTLLYDSRTQALNSGDMSRYLYQLKKMCPDKCLTHNTAYFDIPVLEKDETYCMEKTPKIMEQIMRYASSNENRRYFSPSTINEYISCPLEFYLKNIEGLKVDDDVVEYMDESTFGTILHQVAELSYKRLKGDAEELYVTENVLDRLLNENVELERLVTSAINQHYNKLPSETSDTKYLNLTPLFGEARVISGVMMYFMKLLFRLEKSRVPFFFVEGEHSFECRLPLSNELSINLRGIIDRIDKMVDGSLCIIDYKTGNDDVDVDSFDHLFQPKDSNKGHYKAVLQLFLYCNAYRIEKRFDSSIHPMLYRFKKFCTEGLKEVTVEKEPLNDYRDLNSEFIDRISEKLLELFNPEIPFLPDPHPMHCKYCNFKAICGQAIESSY